MTPTPVKSSKQLAADQAAWEAGKQARENQIRELDIALDALGPKVEKARELLNETKAELATLDGEKRALTGEVEAMRTARAEAAMSLESVQADLVTLEDIATRKRADIDTDMEAYGRAKRKEYDEVLADVQTEIREANGHLDTLNYQVNIAQGILDSARQAAIAQRTETEAQLKQMTDDTEALIVAKSDLEAQIEVLNTELRRVSVERDEAVANRNKAKIEHNNFIKYETQARDILDTKDRELQQKAANLSTDERRLKAKRSFLAELN